MARTNTARKTPRKETHEGAPAFQHAKPEQQLRRSVMSCLLWENEFYEDGQEIAKRIVEAAKAVQPEVLAQVAIEARKVFNLRHAPLLLLEVLSKTGQGKPLVADTIAQVVSRVDEMAELIALHHKMGGKKMLPAQMRKGLARALTKFDEYQLAKYDRDGAVKLRDVFRLVRPKPLDPKEAELWGRAVKGELKTPDTWEVALSGGADKKETFERLLREGTKGEDGKMYPLGYLALLRNLRNMATAGVDRGLINAAIVARKGGAQRVLPFRYVAAARAAPQFEPAIDQALCEAISELPTFTGTTLVLVDVSGSMDAKLSARSDLTRRDAAAALASIIPGDVRVFTFSNTTKEVPPRRGMAGVDAVIRSQPHSGTYLGAAVQHANSIPHDRLIVITDEQSHDRVPDPVCKNAYMINVASYKNGVGYGPKWKHIDGFSEGVIRWIREVENVD